MTADTPLLENKIYLHLLIFKESLLFASQFITDFNSWLAIVIRVDGDGPLRKRLLSSAYIIIWNLDEIKDRSLM